MKQAAVLLPILSIFFSACAKKQESEISIPKDKPAVRQEIKAPVSPENKPSVTGVRSEDPEMAAAIQKAKDSLDSFIAEFSVPKGREFSVKTPMTDSRGGLEYVWADVESFQNGVFSGKLQEDAVNLPGRRKGDRIDIQRADVADWMIFDPKTNDTAGAFTDKVILNRQSQP